MANAFADLGLSPAIVNAVQKAQWIDPTEIQKKAIPIVREGRDLFAIAQTGSGKTGAFLLPILDRIGQTSALRQNPSVLILAPTRELALQLMQNVEFFAPALNLSGALLIGGASALVQKEALEAKPDIIVATPGRLLDHLRQKNLTLCDIEFLVLDEADRMLDMGFLPDIKRILSVCNEKRQSLLFSATLTDEIHLLAQKLLKKPRLIEINANRDVATIDQVFYQVPQSEKPHFLRDLIVDNGLEQVLVFTREKKSAGALASHLKEYGFTVEALHGDKTQAARLRAWDAFKTGKLRVLVATDLASRGLDVKELPVVFNYELPTDPHDYIHRIGRTGRAGAKGVAYSLVSEKDTFKFEALQKLLKKKLALQTPEIYRSYFESELSQKPIAQKRDNPSAKPQGKQKSEKKKADDRKKKPVDESFDYIFPGF